MLNILWPIFIIVSVIFACINGNISEINMSIFESAEDAIKMIITFFGTICLWNGIIKVLQQTSIMKKIKRSLKPFLKFLFPEVNETSKAYEYINVNIISNLLGLGNAATPSGINAIKELEKENRDKDKISNSMMMLIVLNTASIQIIPTTIIAIRNSLKSENPCSIILPVWIATICASIAAITSVKFISRR